MYHSVEPQSSLSEFVLKGLEILLFSEVDVCKKHYNFLRRLKNKLFQQTLENQEFGKI